MQDGVAQRSINHRTAVAAPKGEWRCAPMLGEKRQAPFLLTITGFLMRKGGRGGLALTVLMLAMIAPCGIAFSLPSAKKPPDYSKFLHSTHNEKNKKGKLVCQDCHAVSREQVDRTQLPPHKACMRCHVEQFTAKDQKICSVCHTNQIVNKVPQLAQFPNFERPTQFQDVMNHKVHVDPHDPAIAQFHMLAKCDACHKLSPEKIYETVPGHPECQTCHNKPRVKPAMSDCAGCHRLRPGNREVSQNTYLRPVSGKFNHQHHEIDPKTHVKIDCAKCHVGVMESKTLASLKPPPMDRCTGCHNGAVVAKKRIFSWGYCLKCHTPAAVAQRVRQPWPMRQQVLRGLQPSE